MTPASLLRRALKEVRRHAGRDALLRIASCYDVHDADTDEALQDAIARAVNEDLDQLVLETAPWGLEIWQAVVQALGEPAPANAEQIIAALESKLGSPRTVAATDVDQELTALDDGCLDEDDDEPTGYPAYEELSTDAVLPWVRTKLANFQRRAARSTFEAMFRENKHAPVLCLPEGGGRTRTAADIVLGAHVAKGTRVVWIRSSRVLLDQVQQEIRELAWLVGELGNRRSLFSISRLGSQHKDVSGDIVLTSPRALARSGIGLEEIEQHGPISLICIDDATMVADVKVKRVLDAILRPRVRLLGLTAMSFDPKDPYTAALRSTFVDGPVFKLSFRDLVEAKHLARPVFIRKSLGSTKELSLPPTEVHWAIRGRKDFPGSVLRAMVATPGRNREILGHWMDQRERYGSTLVFAYDQDHAEAMSRWLTDHGVPNDAIYSGMDPDKRRQRIERFRRKQSEVLVLSGLLTEGEKEAGVQSVVLARPTLSPALYKHMIGHGAHRAPSPARRSVFHVVDCIDDLERYGVSLAGRSAAVDLDADFEDTTTIVVPSAVAGYHQRRNKALVSTRAWQILRRFADDQYSVWGEMVWKQSKGKEKSVIVFHEGIARLRAALDLVEAAIGKDDLTALGEMGKELDWLGAVRDVDWQEMLGDCAETGQPPRLDKAEGAIIPPTVEACGRILAQLVEEMLSGRMTIHTAMDQCDALLADSEPLQEQFTSVIELRQELLKLYHDAISRAQVAKIAGTSDRQEMVEAFVRFTAGVAMADQVLHDAETRAIVKAVSRIFDLTTSEQHQWVIDTLMRYRDEPLDVQETAEKLRASATRAEIYHMYDWLFRVAFADGVFVREERSLLHEAAAALGIPDDEVQELEERYTATLPRASAPPLSSDVGPASLLPAPRLRYCTRCGFPRQLDAEFCVSCGAELPNTVQTGA